MNPIAGLFKSRKFLVLLMDTVVSMVILVGGWYLAPEQLDKIAGVIAILQAPVTMIIYAIASEDNAERVLEASLAFVAEDKASSIREVKGTVDVAEIEAQGQPESLDNCA